MMSKLNHLTRKVLDSIDINQPTQKQLRVVEKLLTSTLVQKIFSYHSQLTAREISCLYLAAKGLTSIEIAEFMNIKTSTVFTHKRNILHKLSCNTFAQAVFEGIRLGELKQKEYIHYGHNVHVLNV